MKRSIVWWGLVLSLSALPSPALPQAGAPTPTLTAEAAQQAAMALWEKRGDMSQFKPTVAAMEAWVKVAPTSAKALIMLGRTYTWYVYSGHQGGTDEQRLALMGKGLEAGRKAWELAPGDIEVDFWLANLVGIYGKLYGPTKSVASYGEIRERLDRVAAKDPTYFHGGVWRYYGRLIDQVPAALRLAFGFDLDDAIAYYDRAIKIESRYFLTWIYRAECYLLREEPDAARRDLRTVLNGNPDALPGFGSENRVFQKQARTLWNQHFPGETP